MEIKAYLAEKQSIINCALKRYLPPEDQYPPTIHRAIRYSLFAGGKRLRPILALASYEALREDSSTLLPAACALELIHTYSLIHDDLPAMDNDDFRRGQPTSHKVFGEAIAILAGDALLTLAFELLASSELETAFAPEICLRLVRETARAAGSLGLIGGQVVDIESEGQRISPAQLEYIHTHKTGCLIRCATRLGAIAADAGEEELAALTAYGEKIGLAFQIIDDILDVEGSLEQLGKSPGSDQSSGKATYPAVWGLEQARVKADTLIREAEEALSVLGEGGEILRHLARFILKRRS